MGKYLLTFFVALGLLFAAQPDPPQADLPPVEPPSIQTYLPFLTNSIAHDWIGPDGGLITAVAIDPQDTKNVYAGTWGGGVYASADGGASWMRSSNGLDNRVIVSLAIDPAHPATLYAGTYHGGVYKTTGSANSWKPANAGIQDGAIVYSIVIDPQNSNNVYIATRGYSNNNDRPWAGVVYRSTDGGVTWLPSLADLGGAGYQDWVYALAIDPSSPATVFGATHEHGPVRTRDSGQSWKILTNGITNHSTRGVAIDPRPDQHTIYTGVWTASGVFKSKDGGDNWTLMEDGIAGASIYSLAINPLQPAILYAATYNKGVMKSDDSALSWFSAGLEREGIASLQTDPVDQHKLFAGTAGDGLFASQDDARSWHRSVLHLDASSVRALIVSPLDTNTYFAGLDGGGVLRSDDLGQTWVDFMLTMKDRTIRDLVLSPSSHLLFALTGGSGLFRCNLDDLSTCWQKVSIPFPQVSLPARHPAPPEESSQESYFSLFSPSPMDPGMSAPEAIYPSLLTMAFAPSDQNMVYLGSAGAGLFRSLDGGSSWRPAGELTGDIVSLAVRPDDPHTVYTAIGSPGSVMASQDGGASWQNLPLPGATVSSLAISPDQPEALLAGTSDGVYRFFQGSWARLGLGGNTVTALAVSPTRPDLIVAGTAQGAWLSYDVGATWKQGPEELAGFPVQSISLSPDAPRLVFYNTSGSGTLRAGIEK